MKKQRIAIRPLPTPECVIALGPTIAALRKRFPGSTVGLVAEEQLREASLLIPDLEFFAPEPGDETHADYTVDLRGSELLENACDSSDWKSYVQSLEHITVGNPYHMIDLLRKTALVDSHDVNFELLRPEATEELPESLSKAGGLRIAVCTSSMSQGAVESVLDGLANLNVSTDVFMIGTVKDKRVSSRLATHWDGRLSVHDLCGRNSLASNAEVLRSCDMSITGPGLHALLSSGYGTFNVCVNEDPAVGPLFFPYGHGHLVVQKGPGEPLTSILAAILKEIVGFALKGNEGNVPTVDQWQAFADSVMFAYIGKLRLMATQRVENVLRDSSSVTDLYLRPLLFMGAEIHDVLQTFYRLMWEHSLSGRLVTSNDLQILQQDTAALLSEMLKPMEQLHDLAYFGRTYSGYVKESLCAEDVERAKHDSQRLQEVDELIHSLGISKPFLAPLTNFHRIRQSFIDAEQPIAMADEMGVLFTAMQGRVLVLLDLAKTLFHTVFQSESALAANSRGEAETNG